MLLLAVSRWLAVALAARPISHWMHELAHVLMAHLLGRAGPGLQLEMRPGELPSVTVPGPLSRLETSLVHHAGWIASVLLALGFLVVVCRDVQATSVELLLTLACFTLTACEAVFSDLLGSSTSLGNGAFARFYCGNFGLLLLQQANSQKVALYLHRMLNITMMRGAQSAGMVTYTGGRSVRRRVVNGKRSDLSRKLMRASRSMARPCVRQI